MKKNSGFTLVELLAVIVIIGILSFYAVPRITGLFTRSRNKMYVSDSLKFTSMVEQLITSSKIDKPDNGNSIIVCFKYLDTNDLNSPPNQGKYIDSSFVVAKNNNGVIEYSVMLVEKIKGGGYKGVELTRVEDLQKDGATNHIKEFSNNQINELDNELDNELESKSKLIEYINSRLVDNFISDSSLEKIYYNIGD